VPARQQRGIETLALVAAGAVSAGSRRPPTRRRSQPWTRDELVDDRIELPVERVGGGAS
jgi:hypothetical protein